MVEPEKMTERQGDLDNPQTPFETEMFAACIHAEQHLTEGYSVAMSCGLNNTAAKSTGVMLALTRMLGAHMVQHHCNQLLTKEHALKEISVVVKNLELLINDNFDECMQDVLAHIGKEETKQ